MDFADFYDIAVYSNANWKGGFTQKEIACNAYDYTCEFRYSRRDGKPTRTIIELLKLLKEDGNEECSEWARQIEEGIGM